MKQTAEHAPHWIRSAPSVARFAAVARQVTISLVLGSLLMAGQEPDNRTADEVQADSTAPDKAESKTLPEVDEGRATLTLKGHTATVRSVAFSPDGKRMASASEDGTVKLWDATTGQETLTLKGHTNYVSQVAFHPDGKRLASASYDRTVKLWDATSGAELLTPHAAEADTNPKRERGCNSRPRLRFGLV